MRHLASLDFSLSRLWTAAAIVAAAAVAPPGAAAAASVAAAAAPPGVVAAALVAAAAATFGAAAAAAVDLRGNIAFLHGFLVFQSISARRFRRDLDRLRLTNAWCLGFLKRPVFSSGS